MKDASCPIRFLADQDSRVRLALLLMLILTCGILVNAPSKDQFSSHPDGKASTMVLAQMSATGVPPTAAASANCQPSSTSLWPKDVASLYGYNQMWARGFLGSGRTIYLVEIDAALPADIQNYFACVGVSPDQLKVTTVGTPPQQVLGEATLDIQMVAGLARQATIVDVQTDGNAPGDVWQHINACLQTISAMARADGPGASVVSISLGQPENLVSPADRQAIDTSFATLAMEGVPVFVASGDNGATNTQRDSATPPSFPSSDPLVTSVGGTLFVPAAQGARTDSQGRLFIEEGWTGSGGGTSGIFPRPTYQQAPGLLPSVMMRQVPDVAAVASDLALYLNGRWITAGGTSAAAPIWAAGAALVGQATSSAATGGKSLFPQALYEASATRPGAYFDITVGANPLPVGPGWDPVTGLGTPNLPELVQAMQ